MKGEKERESEGKRRKMFRLHRHKPDKSGHRFHFNFSGFQALQVPKGWDKLCVSIISVETGRTTTKTGKSSVRTGNCRWTETLSDSIWIPQDDASKEVEQCLFKLVVAMGSSRSGILGEATVNLAGYVSSKASFLLSLPLEKCHHGTTLQVKIQCLTPRTTLRDEQWQNTNSHVEDSSAEYDDLENISDVSDSTFTRSIGSSSSNQFDSTYHPGETGGKDTSRSASGSHRSFDSMEGSLGRENLSPQNPFTGVMNDLIGKQDSTSSNSSSLFGSYPANDISRSNRSSFNSKVSSSGSHLQNQRDDFGRVSHAIATSPLRNAGSCKDLEAAEGAFEELRAEARMWEQNARKLMHDLEILRKEFSNQSKNQADLDMELAASHTECNRLRQEIEKLNFLLEELTVRQKDTENLKLQAQNMNNIQQELEDEIKFQKESNANLTIQLKKTQESNIELVSVLQEMEEMIEKQQMEITDLSMLKSKFDVDECSLGHEDWGKVSSRGDILAKRKASCDSDLAGSAVEHPISDLHAEFEPEDTSTLELQLEQLLESQKNLESSIHYLQNTLEDKNHEIEIERDLKAQALLDCQEEWKCKLAAKEVDIISLETKLSEAIHALNVKETGPQNGGDHNLIKEIEALKVKVQELERDCVELTDENLSLHFKIKESSKDLMTCAASFKSLSSEFVGNGSPHTSESEVTKLKSQIDRLEEELKQKEILVEEVTANNFQLQCTDLNNKCTDLELQLQIFKDKACHLDSELYNCHTKAEEQEIEIAALQQQLKFYQEETETKTHLADVSISLENSESHAAIERSRILSELCEQIQLSLANIKKQQYTLYSPENIECKYGVYSPKFLKNTELITQKAQVESILNNLIQLNKLFEAKTTESEDELHSREGIRARNTNDNLVQDELVCNDLKENDPPFSCQGSSSLNIELESEFTDLSKELLVKICEIDKLKANHLLKEEEIVAVRHCQRDLETQISNLQAEKRQLEENMEIMQRESSVTSKCLDDLRNDMVLLNTSMESQVSSNKILERKSLELESSKDELELHLSELEEENVQLSERISGLEAQLRYFTDERESGRLVLQNSESHAKHLQDEIRRLETEMQAQKVDMKQKLQDMQKRWLASQEECEYLKQANPKLQATAESLIEECSSLQKSNGELRKQKLEMYERCTVLEAKLRESQEYFLYCSRKIEDLEETLSSTLEEISVKEKTLNTELETLVQENRNHKEKLAVEENLLNQMYLEKTVEVEDLKREIAHLSEQISATQDEREQTASEAVLEVSCLRADKAKLEAALQEVKEKFTNSENKLNTVQVESETKLMGLVSELAATRQNQEVLAADHAKLLGLLAEVKSNEEKLKGTINRVGLKLKTSEYEMQQQTEEISSLKMQLQKTALLQDEVLALKRSLNEAKFENERLEASLQLQSADYEDLKAEKISFIQKISSMQAAVSELEDCKSSKVALEEKILRLEGDLTAREALCARDAEMKNELGRIKRTNSQFRWKIKYLEEEKEECLNRTQALEEELKKKKEVNQDQSESSARNFPVSPESNSMGTPTNDKLNPLEVDNYCSGSSHVIEDPMPKIQLLENRLSEALETNEMYRVQLKSLLSGEQSNHSYADKKVRDEGGVKKEGYKDKVSSLEAELREIQERYSQMSLKYAEVEAEREELVMKLKTVNSRSWF